ncbi:LysR family transcriptional regulator [Bdellovibrio sp. KM01]|uniref:LysR family transcriptional regulator n=1 Tax=Bdellovibrio sp. KM01 TaxID=2748865 RepID=UPI0015EA72B9|nr:LysR family transcriptional regulator [Bdellovibrio sp. KM01]QLY26380.1 LysR family transcriptional regulator [Bdellovibrio sp. KM01]
MDKNRLDGLLALKLVAEKRNFTAAASELDVSPSAISQMIRQLETRLGVTLLTRTTRTTSLTEAGQRFLSEAGPALDQILNAMDSVGTLGTKPSGLLRLNMPRSLYHSFMEPIVSSFIKKYPEVTVELYLEDYASDIFESGFDAGVRLSDILAKDVIATKLYGPVRFVVAGSPKYFDKHGRPKKPRDLLSHNCILIRLGGGLYDRWEFQERGKDFQVHVKGNLIFSDSNLMLDAAIAGHGLVYAAEENIKEKVKSGKLEVALASYAAESEGFYLYYPSRSQILPKLRAFIDHVKAYIKK